MNPSTSSSAVSVTEIVVRRPGFTSRSRMNLSPTRCESTSSTGAGLRRGSRETRACAARGESRRRQARASSVPRCAARGSAPRGWNRLPRAPLAVSRWPPRALPLQQLFGQCECFAMAAGDGEARKPRFRARCRIQRNHAAAHRFGRIPVALDPSLFGSRQVAAQGDVALAVEVDLIFPVVGSCLIACSTLASPASKLPASISARPSSNAGSCAQAVTRSEKARQAAIALVFMSGPLYSRGGSASVCLAPRWQVNEGGEVSPSARAGSGRRSSRQAARNRRRHRRRR